MCTDTSRVTTPSLSTAGEDADAAPLGTCATRCDPEIPGVVEPTTATLIESSTLANVRNVTIDTSLLLSGAHTHQLVCGSRAFYFASLTKYLSSNGRRASGTIAEVSAFDRS
jgi:hypothetical protein